MLKDDDRGRKMVAYRKKNGLMRHAAPPTRTLSIVFRSEEYTGVIDDDLELPPQQERVYPKSTTTRHCRFPTADAWEDRVSEKLKQEVRDLERKAIEALPKIERVAVPEKIVNPKIEELHSDDSGESEVEDEVEDTMKKEVKEEVKEEDILEYFPRPRKGIKSEDNIAPVKEEDNAATEKA